VGRARRGGPDARRAGGLPRPVIAGAGHDRPGLAAQDLGSLVEPADAGASARPLGEPAGGLHLRPHRAGGEVHPAQLGRRGVPDRARGGRAPAGLDLGDIGEHQQEVGSDLLGEQRGGQILVDHGLDAGEARRREDDRDPAAPGADDEHACVEQEPDRLDLDDPGRLRRCHDAADVQPVRPHRPAALRGEPLADLRLVHRADRLRRHGEARVGGVDDRLREQRCDAAPNGELVQERLVEEIADHPLRLGAEDVQRIRPHVLVRLGLERQEPDLRPVAVRDDEAVRVVERRDRLRRGADVDLLVGGLRRLTAAQEGVPAECDDRERGHRSPQARRMYAYSTASSVQSRFSA